MIKRILILLLLGLVVIAFVLYTPDKSVVDLKVKYTDEQSQFVHIQDMDVHYKIEGQGTPLLLLHGTGASLHTWDDWTEMMKDSFKIIRLDLPAYGLTGPRPDRDYKMLGYVSFLDDFMKAIGIDSFHIAGNSFGGGLAFAYAGEYREKVGKLILIDAGGLPRDKQGESPLVFRLAQNSIVSSIMKKITPKSFIEKNMIEVYADDNKITDAIVTRYHDMAIREGNRQAFIDRVNSQSDPIDHYLQNLEEETLIMWGEEDAWISVSNAARFDLLIPNSTIKIYPDVGHLPMEEYPTQSAKDALHFLRQ